MESNALTMRHCTLYNVLCLDFLFVSADQGQDGAQDRMKTKIKVNHIGTNTWMAPTIMQSSCKINVQYFPFDEQVCINIFIESRVLKDDFQSVLRMIRVCLHFCFEFVDITLVIAYKKLL